MSKLMDYASQRQKSAYDRRMPQEKPTEPKDFVDPYGSKLSRYAQQRIDPLSELTPDRPVEPEMPTWPLGHLSGYFESKHDSKAIGYVTDPEMPDYGKFQMSSSVATVQDFVNWTRTNAPELYKHLSPHEDSITKRGGSFERAWKRAVDKDLMGDAEDRYIIDTHYKFVLNRLPDDLQELIKSSPVLQDIVFSTAVQHGGTRSPEILTKVYEPGMDPDQWLKAVYDERATRFPSYPQQTQDAIRDRFQREVSKALEGLAHEEKARDKVQIAAARAKPASSAVAPEPDGKSARETAWNTAKEILTVAPNPAALVPHISKDLFDPDYMADPDEVQMSRMQNQEYSPELEQIMPEWLDNAKAGLEEPGIPNPFELFAGIWGGTAWMLAKRGLKGGVLLAKSLLESSVGTATSAPVFLLSKEVRDRWGWGPALVTELAAGLGTAMTFDRFIINRVQSLGTRIGTSRRLEGLKNMSQKDQAAVTEELDQVLRAIGDRKNVIAPSVGKTTGREPMGWSEFLGSNQWEIVPATQLMPENLLQRRLVGPRHADSLEFAIDLPEAPAVVAARYREVNANLPMPLQYIRPSGLARQVSEAKTSADIIKAIQTTRSNKVASDLIAYSQRDLKNSHTGLPVRMGTDPARKVNLVEREMLIRQIAAKKNAAKLTVEDEFQADAAQILGDMSPKLETEVPAAPRITEQQRTWLKAQEEMDAFLSDDPSGFHRGMTRKKASEASGHEPEVHLRECERSAYLEAIDGDPDATRSFGDTVEDLYTVFGHKIGFTTYDVTHGTQADAIKAAERLARDLKFHRREALKQGITLQQWYMQQGLSTEMANRLSSQADALHSLSPKELMAMFDKQLSASSEEVAPPTRRPEAFDPNSGYGVALGSKISVEYPYRAVGAAESGYAFKTHASVQTAFEDQITSVVRRLYMGSDTNLRKMTPKQRGSVLLKAENDKYDLSRFDQAVQRRIEIAAREVRRYLDHAFDRLHAEDILAKPFHEAYVDRLTVRVLHLLQKRQGAKPDEIKKIDASLNKTRELMTAVQGTKYVPLLLEWADLMNKTKHPLGARVVNILSQKKREVPSLKWLMGLKNKDGTPWLEWEHIDPAMILGAYGRRIGKDISNQRLKRALVHDGLVRPIPRDKHGKPKPFGKNDPARDWPEIDASMMPFLKGHVAQPNVRRYLYEYYNTLGKHGWVENVLNTVKMFQFYNPFILGMYNTYQSAMLHGVQSWRIPAHTAKAVRDVMRNTRSYQEAVERGLSSKPYPNPLGSWHEALFNAQMPYKNRFLQWTNLLPHKAIKNYYNVAWDTAWTMDPILRMASYRELLRRGYGKRESAQLAALFHGDYASVPPQTRRLLNKFFFTPTFKIVMGQMHKQMAEAAVKSATKIARGQLPGMKTRALAAGAVMLGAINVGRHMLMASLGFETDQWGRRYYKEIEDEHGNPYEFVITMADPANLFIKYAHYIHEAFWGRPSEKTWIGKLAQDLRYEVHPLYRVILGELAANHDWQGNPITHDGQSAPKKALLQAAYVLQQFLPVTKVYDYRLEETEEREILDKHLGKIQHKLLNVVAFAYVRKPQQQRIKYDVRKAMQRLQRAIGNKQLTEEEVKRAEELLRKYAEEYDR